MCLGPLHRPHARRIRLDRGTVVFDVADQTPGLSLITETGVQAQTKHLKQHVDAAGREQIEERRRIPRFGEGRLDRAIQMPGIELVDDLGSVQVIGQSTAPLGAVASRVAALERGKRVVTGQMRHTFLPEALRAAHEGVMHDSDASTCVLVLIGTERLDLDTSAAGPLERHPDPVGLDAQLLALP